MYIILYYHHLYYKIVNDYAMTCGFKNKKELLSYKKAVIKLANKVK